MSYRNPWEWDEDIEEQVMDPEVQQAHKEKERSDMIQRLKMIVSSYGDEYDMERKILHIYTIYYE